MIWNRLNRKKNQIPDFSNYGDFLKKKKNFFKSDQIYMKNLESAE